MGYIPGHPEWVAHTPWAGFRMVYPRYVGYERGETYHPEKLDFASPSLASVWDSLFVMPQTEDPAELQQIAVKSGWASPDGDGGYSQTTTEEQLRRGNKTLILDWASDPYLAEWRHIEGMAEAKATYGFYEIDYPLANDAGLVFGESSCNARPEIPNNEPGFDLFGVSNLMQFAAQRCATPRCAVRLMGALAERYGFQQESPGEGEGLSVAGRNGEAWVFHILGNGGRSATWAAERARNNDSCSASPRRPSTPGRMSVGARGPLHRHGQ